MNEYKKECLKKVLQYAELLKENGFDVYIPEKENFTYFKFSKNSNIGYVQYDYMSGFSFSTVHIPHSSCGTGYRIKDGVSNPTIEDAEKTFINRPNWASMNDEVKKYHNWEHYISCPVNKILKYIKM